MYLPRVYGLTMAGAVALSYLYVRKQFKRLGWPIELLDSAFFIVVLFGFVGARVYHVLSEISLYIEYPMRALYVWEGGLSIFGAILGGAVGLYVFSVGSKKYRSTSLEHLSPWKRFFSIASLIVPVLPFAQALGRLGNYFNHELYGLPSNLPWAIYIAPEYRLSAYLDSSYFHPWFAYEAILNVLVGCALLVLAKRKAGPKTLVGLYFLSYGVVRSVLEPFRSDSLVYFGIHVNMLVSMAFAIAGILLLALDKKKSQNVRQYES